MAVGAVTSLASSVVTRVAAVANSVIVIRALGVNDVGVFAIIGLVIAVAGVASTAGIPPALVKFLAELGGGAQSESGQLVGAGLVLITVSAVLTTVALGTFALVSANVIYGDPRVSLLIIVGLLGSIIGAISGPFFAVLQGFERIKEMNAREIAISVASVPTTLLLVQQFAVYGAVLVGAASGVIAIVVKAPVLHNVWREKRIRLGLPRNKLLYRRILGFAIPAFVSTLMITPILWLVESLLATRWSFGALGEYSVVYALAGYVVLISGAVGVPMVPVVSRLEKEGSPEVAKFLVKTFRITAFLTLPPAIVLIGYPVPFLRMLYGPEYVSSAFLMTMLGPALILASLSGVVGFAIAGVGRMWDGFLLNLVWAGSIVLLSMWLVPGYGALGLAASFLGAYLLHFVGAISYARSVWSIKLNAVAAPLGFCASAITMSVVAFSLPRPWNLIAALAGAGATAAAEFRVMSDRERQVVLMPLRMVIRRRERLK